MLVSPFKLHIEDALFELNLRIQMLNNASINEERLIKLLGIYYMPEKFISGSRHSLSIADATIQIRQVGSAVASEIECSAYEVASYLTLIRKICTEHNICIEFAYKYTFLEEAIEP